MTRNISKIARSYVRPTTYVGYTILCLGNEPSGLVFLVVNCIYSLLKAKPECERESCTIYLQVTKQTCSPSFYAHLVELL